MTAAPQTHRRHSPLSAAPTATAATSTASASGFQASADAFFNPFIDLVLDYSAGQPRLVAAPDGHRGSERKFGNVRKHVGEIRNV
jgi:hypothetical protein